MSPAPRQKNILSDKTMSEMGLSLHGNLMRVIRYILNLGISLRIRFPSLICYSMLEMMRHITSGDGEKRQEQNLGLKTQNLCYKRIAIWNYEVAI